MFAPHFLIW